MALRFLIHYIGDIHQPIHCITKVDSQFPSSDSIGTLFKLADGETLHSAFDEVVYNYKGLHVALPIDISGAGWVKLGNEAKRITSAYTCSACDMKTFNPKAWGQESFTFGKAAYQGLTPGKALTADYIQQHQVKAFQHLVTGGNRLANALLQIFNPTGQTNAVNNIIHYVTLYEESDLFLA